MRDWIQAAIRDEWDGLGRISQDIRLADIATMMNALLGIGAIWAASIGSFVLAAELVMLCVIVDGVDGFIARLGFGGGPLGPTLDTLADVVSFAVAPAILLLLALPGTPATYAIVGFFVICVLLRLARFESLREQRPRMYFSGMSSPGGALVAVSLVLAGLPTSWILGGTAVAAVVMISRVRYPKLRGALGIVAVILLLAVLVTTGRPHQDIALIAMVAFMGIYGVAGPFYVLARFGPTKGVQA